MSEPRILVYDIETYPALAYVWGAYDQNIIDIHTEWGLLGFAWKWLGDKTVRWVQSDGMDDTEVVKKLHELFDEADIIVAHNGDRFDRRKANAQFLKHGLGPPSHYQTVDTKKVSSRHFAQYKNNLDYLGKRFGLGRKIKTEGFDLWLGCMANDPAAWRKMKAYAKQDVNLLEEVYLEMRGWIDNHPNLGVISKTADYTCPNCGSSDVQRRGYRHKRTGTHRQFRCNECGRYSTSRYREPQTRDTGVQLV